MTTRPSIAIIGGGIGGLFAANALIAKGMRVSVHEQAAALGEIGAGVYVTPNAVRHLERVGLGPAVERWGARVGPDSHYFRHDGTPIAPVQVTDGAGWNACFGMHRADLVSLLAAHLPAGVVHTGHRAIGFEQDGDGARVRFANGATAEADVVVGADGIHSELRPFVFRLRSRSFTAPSPTVAWLRASACRTGRWIAGRCGPVPRSTSWSFRCATARWSTTSASCRPTRR